MIYGLNSSSALSYMYVMVIHSPRRLQTCNRFIWRETDAFEQPVNLSPAWEDERSFN